MMNQVIIDNIDIKIENYNGTGVDYYVNVYAVDTEENDDYGIKIWNTETNELHAEYHADSSGNVFGDEAHNLDDALTKFVHDILFIKREHGIIRGF